MLRRIELVTLVLHNFRSFRKLTKIDLTPTSGLKFITGDNQLESRMGANGAGKSTLWDAVCWSLYGTSVRGLRASSLASWGEKQAKAGVTLLVDGSEFIIDRTGGPERIYINGRESDQKAVNDLLGLSRAQFLQAVLYGQQVPLFADLTVPERGALFDEMLDLTIWNKAADLAGKKHTEATKQLQELDTNRAYQKGLLDGLPSVAQLEAEAADWETKQGRLLDQAIDAVEKEEKELTRLSEVWRRERALVAGLPDLRHMQNQITTLHRQRGALESEFQRQHEALTEATRLSTFFRTTKECPTCKQTISSMTAHSHMRTSQDTESRLKTTMKQNGTASSALLQQINALEADHGKESRTRDFRLTQQVQAEAAVHAQQRVIDSLVKQTEDLAQSANPHAHRITTLAEQAARIKADLTATETAQNRQRADIIYMDFWRQAFKRMRLFVVKRVLLQLEIETNNAANTLGLLDWRIHFSTEQETKSGTIRPGIHILISSPVDRALSDAKAPAIPWEAWSGGEGQRLRLAVTMGLSSMIQRLSAVDYGFEIWDEPTAWLHDLGIQDLMEYLKQRADSAGRAVWLCDHRALIHSAFDEVWCVTKTEDGSSVAMLSASAS